MIIKKLPYERFYVEANEKWLNAQKECGLTLIKVRHGKAEFEETDDRAGYLIDPAGKHNEAMLAEAGWRKLSPFGMGFAVYVSAAREPWIPAPLTSAGKSQKQVDEVLGDMRAAVKKQQTANLWLSVIPVFVFLLLFMMGLAYYFNQSSMVLLRDWQLAIGLGTFLLAVLSMIHYFRRENALKQWSDNRLLVQTADFYGKIKVRNEKESWPLEDRMGRISRRGAAVILAVMAVCLLLGILLQKKGPVRELKQPYVSLAKLEQGDVSENSFEAFNNTYQIRRSLCVPYQCTVHLGGSEEDYASIGLRTQEYRALTEKMARDLLQDSMSMQLSWNSIMQSVELESELWDEAYYAGYQSLQYLFLRKGKTVLTVYYMGPEKLDESIDVFEGILPEK